MKVTVKRSTMVKPMEETASGSLWLSSLDLVLQPHAPFHARLVFFYRSNGAANFFDAAVLKAALSRALVEFYPYAGRLRKDENGRLEINCNGQGALFVEAECDAAMDELGGFSPRPDVSFLPTVNYSNGISSFPLSLLQITRFKCGGVSLGMAIEHHLADGPSQFEFILAWCDICRGGGGGGRAIPPFLDRRILAARNPPRRQFSHIEHEPPPPLIKTPLNHSGTTTFRIFRLAPDHINALKQNYYCKGYTTYEVVTGHVWRCVSIARRLLENQETKLQFPINGRRRLVPPLPAGYVGNVNFFTAAVATCGELESNPLRFAVGKVHEAIARMDNEYLRSAVDDSELRLRLRSDGVKLAEDKMKCPNLGMTSWIRLPFEEMDFGWGKPVYGGPGAPMTEGKCCLFVDLEYEKGSIKLAIALYDQHMDTFQQLLYRNIISKI